jgi:methyl-accepting chemotaxis protein
VTVMRSEESLQREADAVWRQSMAIGLAALAASMAAASVFAAWLTRPLHAVEAVLRQVSQGDLSHRPPAARRGEPRETAHLIEGLERMLGTMGSHADTLQGLGTVATRTSLDLRDVGQRVRGEADASRETAHQVSRAVEGISSSVGRVKEQTSDLARLSGSAAAVLEAVTGETDKVAKDARALAEGMSRTLADIAAVDEAAREIASTVSRFEKSLEPSTLLVERGREMAAMVQGQADTTVRASRKTLDHVARGVQALDRTRAGVDLIQDRWNSAVREIESLQRSIAKIVGVLLFMRDLAETTKLLSLNAAITASHAGPEGAAFAVVADEVRRLSDSTSASIREISQMVHSVEERARGAGTAVQEGADAVVSGMRLAVDAGEALAHIERSVQESNKAVNQIISAATEQSSTSKALADLLTEFAGHARVVMSRTGAQTASTSVMAARGRAMQGHTERIRDYLASLAERCRSVSASMTQVAHRAADIDGQQQEQARASHQLGETGTNLVLVSEVLVGAADEMTRAIDTLNQHAHTLEKEVRVYRRISPGADR